MEFTTLEQYVLAELEQSQEENERLREENDKLSAQIQILEGLVNAQPTKMQEYIVKKGRKAVYNDLTGYGTSVTEDGERVPFEKWCEEHVRDYSFPRWLTQGEFIKEFEPEFRKEYEDAINEEDE